MCVKVYVCVLRCGLKWLSRCLFRCLFRHRVQLSNEALRCGIATWLAALNPWVIGQIHPLTRPGTVTHCIVGFGREEGKRERKERERDHMANGSWVFSPRYEISQGCLGFRERDQDVIIKPASMRHKCGAHVNTTETHTLHNKKHTHIHQSAGFGMGTMPRPVN